MRQALQGCWPTAPVRVHDPRLPIWLIQLCEGSQDRGCRGRHAGIDKRPFVIASIEPGQVSCFEHHGGVSRHIDGRQRQPDAALVMHVPEGLLAKGVLQRRPECGFTPADAKTKQRDSLPQDGNAPQPLKRKDFPAMLLVELVNLDSDSPAAKADATIPPVLVPTIRSKQRPTSKSSPTWPQTRAAKVRR